MYCGIYRLTNPRICQSVQRTLSQKGKNEPVTLHFKGSLAVMKSENEGMWWKQRSDWIGEKCGVCSVSHTRQALLVIEWDSMSTTSNTSKQKGCPHPPLGLEWCLGHEGWVQWRGWTGDWTGSWLLCPHARWSRGALDDYALRKMLHARRGSRVEITKGPEMVPWGFGRSLVPQSFAHRGSLWEAPSHGAYPPLPPLCVRSCMEERASFPLTAE